METAYLQIDYAKAIDVANAIEDRLSPDGSVTHDARLNTVRVTDSPDVVAQIRDYVKRVDRPEEQILIDVEIMQLRDRSQECEGGCASLSSYRVPIWGVGGTLGQATGAQQKDKQKYSLVAAPRLIVGDGDWADLAGHGSSKVGPWLSARPSMQADQSVVLDLHFMNADSCAAVAQLHLFPGRMVALDWPFPLDGPHAKVFVSARAMEPLDTRVDFIEPH